MGELMTDFPPAHPGEVLSEDFLKPLGMSQYALAKALSVPEIRISELVRGKRAITPDTALRLARYFRHLSGVLAGHADDLRSGAGARAHRSEDRGDRAPARGMIQAACRHLAQNRNKLGSQSESAGM
jgi:addiction module HigA family antidote